MKKGYHKSKLGQTIRSFIVKERIPNKDKGRTPSYKIQCINCGIEREERAHRIGKQKCKCSQRLKYGESIFNSVYAKYKVAARNRGLMFDLTKEQFKIFNRGNCNYCGIIPSLTTTYPLTGAYGSYTYNGIDRVDNSIGYLFENS